MIRLRTLDNQMNEGREVTRKTQEIRVFEYCQTHDPTPVTARQIREDLGIPLYSLRYILSNRLLKKGFILKQGVSGSAKYIVNPKWKNHKMRDKYT